MYILTIIPLPLERNKGDSNPSQRLAEIRSKINAVEMRIRDLEALLTELILTPTTDLLEVSGVTYLVDDPASTADHNNDGIKDRRTSDANTVRQALYAARAFEGELRTAEQFWNQIVQANKEAEKDTHDLFKRG